MTKVIAIAMNKGGVGKTSLVTNLAAAIASTYSGKKALIIDTDGQGNSSIAFGKNPQEFEHTIYDVFLGEIPIRDAIVPIAEGLDLIPANQDMNLLEFDVLMHMDKYPSPFLLLKNNLATIKDQYDYILVDSPPSMGLISGNVLAAADSVIIPFVPELFAVQGLIRVIETMDEFIQRTNSNLKLSGIVGMMVDSRTILHSEMLQKARQYCLKRDLKMFETIIPKSIRFANSTAYEGKPAVWTDKSNPIVSAYFELLDEVMKSV